MPFRVALTGLRAASADLKVTGNNIANSTTVGFKQSRTEFVDVYAKNSNSISTITAGSGVRVADISQIFTQGATDYTDSSTDLAITGDGFFVVSDDKGVFYTRAGSFGVDREGMVVNSTNQKLQVFQPVTVGDVTTFNTGELVDLQLNTDIGAPRATTLVSVDLNVDADLPAFAAANGTDTVTSPFILTDPTTYQHVTSTTLYDSLGAPHISTTYYRKIDAGPNLWQSISTIDGTVVDPLGAPGAPAQLQFNQDGTLASVIPAAANPKEVPYNPFTPANTGSAPITFGIDYGDTTQFGSDFGVNAMNQDGYSTGTLSSFDVAEDGVVYARYSNGNADVLGKIALAGFANPQGLGVSGDSLWTDASEAGDRVVGEPGSASFGLIQAGALETSNVEIAAQLVNLIVAQRNYQANAEVISTADTITQTLINI